MISNGNVIWPWFEKLRYALHDFTYFWNDNSNQRKCAVILWLDLWRKWYMGFGLVFGISLKISTDIRNFLVTKLLDFLFMILYALGLDIKIYLN